MNNLTFLAFCLAFACYALAFFLLWRRQTLRAQDVLDADEITDATSAGPALMIALLGLVGPLRCYSEHPDPNRLEQHIDPEPTRREQSGSWRHAVGRRH
jgi:hypothetical protein